MIHISATEAKVHFGKWLDVARQETVSIEKQGRSRSFYLKKSLKD